jgi:hypothetical protein
MINDLALALIHAAAVGVIACLISESTTMSPVRNYFNYTLLFCPICLSFWIAIPALFIGLFHYFLVVAMSNIWMLLILKVYEAIER